MAYQFKNDQLLELKSQGIIKYKTSTAYEKEQDKKNNFLIAILLIAWRSIY